MANRDRVRSGRLSRAGMLGGMAAGLAGDVVGAATKLGRTAVSSEFHKRAADRLLRSLGEMKGLPMKMGQMLSYVDDMIPPEHREIYRETLKTLRVISPTMSFEVMSKIVEEDLGRPLDEVFAEIDREPIAAASIGQVYRGRLEDGQAVAIKVQYPGIKAAIESDLRNADTLISAFSVILPKMDLENTIGDVTARLLEECDYACELCNQQEFARAFAGDPEIFVPRVIESCSGSRVLVSELVEGAGWDEVLLRDQDERSRLGRIIFRFVFESLYRHGMFNADPHPGNYIFLEDGRVAFLDYGCVQRFPPDTLEAFVRVRREVVDLETRGPALRSILGHAYGIPEGLDDDVWDIIEEYVVVSFEPLIREQPFRYDRAFTERITRMTMDAKLKLMKKLFKLGIQEAKRPGLVFMNRINFGLNSILAALEAEADWRDQIALIEA